MPRSSMTPARLRRSRGFTAPGAALALLLSAAPTGPATAADTAEVEHGARVYAAECAACHGAALEGQPRWWQADASGRVPAPPLDASGHAWQHPDAQLVEFVAHGM